MVLKLKLRKVGNSVGVILPKEILTHLKVAEGDTICVTKTVDGGRQISPPKAKVKNQLEIAQSVIRRYRRTLRELS